MNKVTAIGQHILFKHLKNRKNTPLSEVQSLYLDLLIKSLANTIYADNSIHPGVPVEYDYQRRSVGGDWPSIAHSMIGLARLNNLRECVETVIRDGIPGDLIETGVWRGGACILMRGILKAYGIKDRRVFVADSFCGLPPPNPEVYQADKGDLLHTYSELAISRTQVEQNFKAYDLLDEQVCFVEGWFRDTLPNIQSNRFALIRLDGDMYESTIQALEALYPKLSRGGFSIIDDYGAIPACRVAVEDYRTRNKIDIPLQEIDWTGVYWRKT